MEFKLGLTDGLSADDDRTQTGLRSPQRKVGRNGTTRPSLPNAVMQLSFAGSSSFFLPVAASGQRANARAVILSMSREHAAERFVTVVRSLMHARPLLRLRRLFAKTGDVAAKKKSNSLPLTSRGEDVGDETENME